MCVCCLCAQAWIMNDTLQENVIMGDEQMDGVRYKEALKVGLMGPVCHRRL